MIRLGSLVLLVLIVCVGRLDAGSLSGGLHWDNKLPTEFRSVGEATYRDADGHPSSATLSGTHKVSDWIGSSPAMIYLTRVTGDGSYSYTLSGPATDNHCYDTWLDVTADPPGLIPNVSRSWYEETECVVTDPPPRDPITLCDDGSNSGQCSPIVINLAGGPLKLSGPDDPVNFDIDANGTVDRITWTARDSAVAFLALDRNGNGQIDDGSELFGDSTRLASGARAANGFEALKELDLNGDALVNAFDGRWTEVLLWTDFNHDGISQPPELQRAADSEVRAFETRYHWTGRVDAAGNLFRYQGAAHLTRSRQPLYDVYFRSVP